MALETVESQQDPFSYGCRHFSYSFDFEEEKKLNNCEEVTEQVGSNGYNCWDSSPPISATRTPSPELCAARKLTAAPPLSRQKRRRGNKCGKNKEEIEKQRRSHIEVERNRRRQMNDYLAVLRSLMPPSYAQRGDQVSIVGGAINFVKELEQLSQFLEALNLVVKNHPYDSTEEDSTSSSLPAAAFSNFFHFPQYSTRRNHLSDKAADEGSGGVADIEVAMVEDHANVKVLSRRRPKQLVKMVTWFHAMCLTILHLNATTIDHMVLYSFSIKVEEECRLSTVNEIATSVHEMVAMIEQETH